MSYYYYNCNNYKLLQLLGVLIFGEKLFFRVNCKKPIDLSKKKKKQLYFSKHNNWKII